MTRYIIHGDKSRSKYKGGFIKGKNTSEYNHDYYIHNRDKWKTDIKRGIQIAADKLSDLYRFVSSKLNQNEAIFPEKIGSESGEVTNIKTKTGNHKYLYRVTYHGRYRYFYSETEYYSFMKNVSKKNGDWSIEEDCAAVNPDYPKEGYTLNCGSCSIAYDIRKRGYDVSATERYGTLKSDVPKIYKNGKWSNYPKEKKNNVRSLTNRLSRYENGARGIIDVNWSDGSGGHLMNWEVVNGTVYFIDAQSNTIRSGGEMERHEFSIDWDSVKYMRTDTLELDEKALDYIRDKRS